MSKYIIIKGAKTNNLKNIDVKIPRGKITAIVGISGAGKSSLAFDTIYAEGYLRYIESISPYIRQFLDKIEKPAVEQIDGLPPAISFKHKKPVKNPRSIVATSLDIFDYLRILYAKISDFFCPGCGEKIKKYSIDEILTELLNDYRGKIHVCFEYEGDIAFLVNRGYYFYMDKGEKKRIDHKVKGTSIPVLIDSVDVSEANKNRLFEAIDRSISFGKGTALIFYNGEKILFPAELYCARCEAYYPAPDEHLFSFNSPKGACPRCKGFGDIQELDRDSIFDKSRSLLEGAVLPFNTATTVHYKELMIGKAIERGIDLHRPLQELPKEAIDFLMTGDWEFKGIQGFFDRVKRKTYKVQARVLLSRYTSYKKCPECGGSRFNEVARSFKIKGKNLSEFLGYSIAEAYDFIKQLDYRQFAHKVSAEVFRDIESRLAYLIDSGLFYIELDRPGFTLSRGEYQRINLAFILGSTLSDSLLIIDQPSSDLHPFDYEKLQKFLLNLKANENTILLIDHNKDVVKFCDYVLELGPLSGVKGGEPVFFGTVSDFFNGKEPGTITQKYFNKPFVTGKKEKKIKQWLQFKNASTHNLKHFDFNIPMHAFTVICGVSGVGKTTLLYNEIYLKNKNLEDTGDNDLTGIKDIVFIDPGIAGIKSTTIAAGFFDFFLDIRELFAAQKESRLSGYTPGHFSFNSALGRCEQCKGKGHVEIEMQFLPPVQILCSDCMGKGYNYDVLKMKYKGKNISEILDLTINRFIDLVGSDFPLKKRDILSNIQENGLGYIKVGQKLNTLSAGELQRIKLLKYLNMNKTGTLFLIDEPSFGLHYHDIEMVKNLIDKILRNRNTVAAAEHNTSLIAYADYIIELGHEGGQKGGFLAFQGNLRDIKRIPDSITGAYLLKD